MTKTVLLSCMLTCLPALAFAAGDEKAGDKADTTTTDKPPGDKKEDDWNVAQKTNAPPEGKVTDEGKMTDTREKNGKYYYFIGLRYRGTVVPQFIMNLFVDGGRTVYNSSMGIEFDIRKDNFSIIPSVMLMEHAMAPTLFLEKGKNPDEAGNWTVVGADVKGLYGAVDLLWSAPISKNFTFDFGFGVGIGVVMGDIANNWVYGGRKSAFPNGRLTSQVNGVDYAFEPCGSTTEDNSQPAAFQGCKAINHRNSEINKVGAHFDPATGKLVGSYTEKGWTSGGSVPSIFPYLSIPMFGLRIKPIKALEFRTMLGFSVTGFFFQISGSYGLEQPTK